jgi:hypothetical protein
VKYLCLVYIDQKAIDNLSASDSDALDRDALAYDQELKNGGHFIAAHALQSVEMATTLRVRNGKLSTTDGPFAETKEQLGGFILIEARDLNEALQLAAKIPPGRFGCIEVRPIKELNPPPLA